MKRYQNPEVFEHLAMSYALGTLQGRARMRFEGLMAHHFYLRAVTQVYQQRFSGLMGLLPAEQPPALVWERIERELALKPVSRKVSAAQVGSPAASVKSRLGWLLWPAMGLSSAMAAMLTVFVLNTQQAAQPDLYFSKLNSPTMESVAMVTASADDMKITVALADGIVADGKSMPTLWCLSKKAGDMPRRMGELKLQGRSELTMDETAWKSLREVGKLAISLEPMDQPGAKEPMGEVIYEGELMSAL